MNNIFETSEETKTALLDVQVDDAEVVLFNDDVNTFDHVIDVLVEVCDHSAIQAEQCAMITHYKGKCSVKKGNKEKLTTICQELLLNGLTAEVR